VLGEHGYYTALVGKNHHTFLNGSDPEFEFYMVSDDASENDGKQFNYNDSIIFIDKQYILTLTDTAIGLINKVQDPLFMWLAYKVPHFPIEPLPSFIGKYDGYPIPWPADTARYSQNYPNFIYKGPNNEFLHGYELDTTYRNVLEMIAGLDSCMGEIFKALETSGKLENTLLMFMSDNGYMLGNHWLRNKTFAYEPSMRVPMFMRYPKWFPDSTEIISQFASNLDIAETVYDAAEVNYEEDYNQPTEGISLRKLVAGDTARTAFYYLKKHQPTGASPTVRAFRDQHYKYIVHSCVSDTVEEFFDMENDPLELTNEVNNSAYNSLVENYRLKLDSMKVVWNDTLTDVLKKCFIQDP
jgi:arylsulfatase A-like enzyme